MNNLDLNTLFIYITLMILMLGVTSWTTKKMFGLEVKKSKVNDQNYLVQKGPNSQIAADLLGKLTIDVEKLIKLILNDDLTNRFILQIQKRFNPDTLRESGKKNWWNSDDTSYSLNKGELIVMCLRQEDGSFVNENTLLFVLLHEVTHIGTKSIGHTPEFWSNFRFLLKKAVEHNIYQYVPYHESNKEYCGTTIQDTPLKL